LWINDFCWTYDPREKTAKTLPFQLFPLQEDFINWLVLREEQENDGLVEKSRDFGMTWLCGAYAAWRWIFTPGWRCGFGSRKLEFVDKLGDFKAILPKIRFMIESLPRWMQPQQYTMGYCLLHNKDNDSSISGEGGDNIGRGDRTSIYFVDEAAFLERPKLVDAALSQTTRVRVDVSTVHGIANSFAMKRHSGETEVFTAHWKDDPRKNRYVVYDAGGDEVVSGNGRPEENAQNVPIGGKVLYPWYEKEKKRLQDPVTIAQELDIDYTASIEGVCIPAKWVQAAVELCKRILALPQGGDLIAALDLAEDGGNQNVLGFRRGVVVGDEILAWTNPSPSFNANKARDELMRRGAKVLNYDAGGGYGGAVADMGRSMENQWHEADHAARMQLIGEASGDLADAEHQAYRKRIHQTLAEVRDKKIPFAIISRQGGETASEMVWPDDLKSKDKFINARAEWWWILRERFRKTYEYVEHQIEHPLDELISIPNVRELIADLSKPLIVAHGDKVGLEPKQKMRQRGIASPDYADMLAMLFAPKKNFSWTKEHDIMNTLNAFYRDEENTIEGTPEEQHEAAAVADLDGLLDAFDAYAGNDDAEMPVPAAKTAVKTRAARKRDSNTLEADAVIVAPPKAKLSL
jgi:hypothetical protein